MSSSNYGVQRVVGYAGKDFAPDAQGVARGKMSRFSTGACMGYTNEDATVDYYDGNRLRLRHKTATCNDTYEYVNDGAAHFKLEKASDGRTVGGWLKAE
jgi:hypothetical protein